MMKHQTTLVTGLAVIFVVPPMAFDQDQLKALEDALAGTVRSLEVLSGLEERAMTDPETTGALVISATEAPFLAEEALDQRLGSLRRQVSLLQMEVDAIENPGVLATAKPLDGTRAVAAPNATSLSPAVGAIPPAATNNAPVFTGLDESMRTMLRTGARSLNTPVSRPTTPATSKPGHRPATIEKDSYSADALGQAKACYHAGRYADALLLLENRTDTTSLYWKSRCFTQLDRFDEAITALTSIVESAGDTYEGRRAATDLDFARWKKSFSEKLPDGLKDGKEKR